MAAGRSTAAPAGALRRRSRLGQPAEHGDLDAEFVATMQLVQSALRGAPRDVRIRGELWAQRLSLLAAVTQDEFRRDRNLHADLLLECLGGGRWVEPLDRAPREGPLPLLPPHVACVLRRKRKQRLDQARASRPCSAERLSGGRQAGPEPAEGGAEEPVAEEPAPKASATSLADVAAARVARMLPVKGSPVHGASVPVAYEDLARRVAHLQDENRRLRLRVRQAQRSLTPGPQPAAPTADRKGEGGTSAGAPRAEGAPRSRPLSPFDFAPAQALAPKPATPCAAEDLGPPALEPSRATESSERSQPRLKPPSPLELLGPAPPEDDTDGFLRYLDAFQASIGSLIRATPTPTPTDERLRSEPPRSAACEGAGPLPVTAAWPAEPRAQC